MVCSQCRKSEAISGRRSCAPCLERNRTYYRENRDRRIAIAKGYHERHRDQDNARKRALRQRARQEAVDAYGGACICCGETYLPYLDLDHINGGGTKHRKQLGWGVAYFKYLKDNHWPQGIQVLCGNCHYAKTRGHACRPH